MAQKQFIKTSKVAQAPAVKKLPTRAPEPSRARPAAEPDKPKYEEMPLVSVFPRQDMRSAIELMSEDVEIQEQVQAFTARRAEIKAQLVDIAERNDVPGMRHGQLVVYYNGSKTKSSLNRALLLENGVTPAQLEASMKESKPYIDLRVVDLSKPKQGHGAPEPEEE